MQNVPGRSRAPRASSLGYLKTFRAAARPVVGQERARHLTLRDLRHCCLTDIAEREGLAAAAYVAGHRSTEMAGRVYVSPQADSAESALRARARDESGTECGTEEKWQGMETRIPYDFRRTRQDSNLRPLPPEGSALSS